MKTRIIKFSTLIAFIAISIGSSSWDSWGHKHISHSAVFTLPNEMRGFYFNHIDFLTEASVVPDLRKSLLNDRYEGPRHYVDVELFNGLSVQDFPLTTKEAFSVYDSSFLTKTGYLPWYIQNLYEKLTVAFKKRNKSEILFLSAEICHYIADGFMPLHTSENHNGQLTGQTGVHALWESVLPPMFGNSYNFSTQPATYIDNVPKRTMEIVEESHALVPVLLAAEQRVRDSFSKKNMFKKDKQGNLIKRYNTPVYSDEYAALFHKELNGMVELQLKLAIKETGNFWYTAWVDAGKPSLRDLDNKSLTRQNRKILQKNYKAWKEGRLLNM